MLVTTQTDSWGMRHEIDHGAPEPAHYRASAWGAGGTITLDGRELRLRSSATGMRQTLLDGDRTLVTAVHVGRKNWSIATADGRVFRFRRTGVWSQSHELLDDQPAAGPHETHTIRITGIGHATLTADLPGLPPEAQVFVAAVLLHSWLNSAVFVPVAVAIVIPLFTMTH